ncbi:hypothetical protein HZA55_07090 [Candidatus Poribacteria bacterium]|nr:hypothetical protein [Candidatus Poribacteria bacterium]
MKKIFLIDGHSYLYRAFYAVKNLSTKAGKPTGAVLGFTNMLLKILKDTPDYIIVTFDSGVPSFRVQKFAEYKIHRKPMPNDLIAQIPIIKEIIDAFNIRRIDIPGVEADDILATLGKKAEKAGIDQITIFTNDKDALQLVNEHIFVQTETNSALLYNIDEVVKRFGNLPSQVPDILALMGDASDNIPGVKGIGPKTAISLIQQFGSLKNLLNSLHEIKSKSTQALLEANKDMANLSYELIKLHTDIPIDINFEDCNIKEFNFIKLADLLKELEFTSLAQKLIPAKDKKQNYIIIDNENTFSGLIETLSHANEFSFSIETIKEHALKDKLIGIAFSISSGNAFYIHLAQNLFNTSHELDINHVLHELKSIFENPNIKKIGHNIKYTYIVLFQIGITIKGIKIYTPISKARFSSLIMKAGMRQ